MIVSLHITFFSTFWPAQRKNSYLTMVLNWTVIELLKELDLIKSSHKSDFFLRKDLCSYMRAQHVLSYVSTMHLTGYMHNSFRSDNICVRNTKKMNIIIQQIFVRWTNKAGSFDCYSCGKNFNCLHNTYISP